MFKVNELIIATHGRLISGDGSLSVESISIDSRTIKGGEVFIAIKGAKFDGHNFINQAVNKGAKVIIAEALDPGVKHKNITFIKVPDTTRALGDIARFQREKFDIPVIIVTGSNGKTTTKDMIAWVLSKDFKVLKNEGTKNNQIGLPLALLNLNRTHEVIVLEAGSNHPGEIAYLARISQPNIAVITNIGPSHLAYFKDLKGVLKEKSQLLKHLKDPRIAILNADDNFLKQPILKKSKKPVIFSFGINNRSDFFAADIKRFFGYLEFSVNRKYKFTLHTFGFYNIYNALVALTIARILGMGYKDISSRLINFDYPENRLKFMKSNNTRFFNDTYNSNPLSLNEALDVLDNFQTMGRKIFVMGDMLELGSSRELFHRRAGKDAASIFDVFVAVGGLSKLAAEAAKKSGFDTRNLFICESNLQAREILFRKICPGPDDIVLVKGSRAMLMEELL